MAYFTLIIIILILFFLWTTYKGAPLIKVSSDPLTEEEIQELAMIRRRNKKTVTFPVKGK